MGDKFTISKLIGGKYYEIKSLLTSLSKRRHECFDEDLFHTTLLNCMKVLGETEMEEREIIGYIIKAFQSNEIREYFYFRNLLRVDLDVQYEENELTPSEELDYKMIIEKITKIFGQKDSEQFQLWLEGYCVREIEERYNEDDVTYRLHKIKAWLSENYGAVF